MTSFKFTHLKNKINPVFTDEKIQEFVTKWYTVTRIIVSLTSTYSCFDSFKHAGLKHADLVFEPVHCTILSDGKFDEIFSEEISQNATAPKAMKGNLRIQHYCFNEPFQLYLKEDLVNSFFRDPEVFNTLQVEPSVILGKACSRAEWRQVPCSVTSMNIFDPICDPCNNVIFDDKEKALRTCEYTEIDGFAITDNLRKMLLDEGDEVHKILGHSEREEFLFRLFKHLCLGGLWCQYEDFLQPYLEVTKNFYKNLVSAEKEDYSGLVIIRSVVLEVTVYGENNEPILPKNPNEHNNFLYLIIDPFDRTVTVLVHQVGRLII